MTEYAYRALATQIKFTPGNSPAFPDVRIYRLPAMMPGIFHLTASRWQPQPQPPHGNPSPPAAPGGPTQAGAPLGSAGLAVLAQPGRAASEPTREPGHGPVIVTGSGTAHPGGSTDPTIGSADPANPPGGPPVAQPEDLVIELYHGGQLVATGANALPLQNTVSDGDDTWTVHMFLAPGSPPSEEYIFNISLSPFPSILPVLTRHIPQAFFQQGFDDNWNGRNYVRAAFQDNTLLVTFDPEVASYYHLPSFQQQQKPPFWGVDLPNIQVKDSHLSIDSTAGGFGFLPGPLTVILLSTKFTGAGGQPIHGSIESLDFSLHDFTVNIQFFLTQDRGYVGYQTHVTSDFEEQLFDTDDEIKAKLTHGVHVHVGPVDKDIDGVDDYLQKIQSFLNGYSPQVGQVLTPWLLGAAFEVLDVSYSPVNSQPVPATSPTGQPVPQGDIVIKYVGQPSPPSSVPVKEDPPPPAVLTITTVDVADGIAGQPYAQQFSVVAGTGTMSWSVTGSLPPGLAFADGQLTGTPATPGIYHIEVTARDAANAQASRAYAVAINTAGLGISTPSPLPDAVVGEAYGLKLSASAGGSETWSASGLPPGLSMSPSGVISGTPLPNGSASTIDVKAIGPAGVAAFKAFQLTVRDPLLFTDPLYAPRGDGNTIWQPPEPPAPVRSLPDHPASTTTAGDLGKVDHIVVVMMENRSFDHMLGYLSREGGRADVEGLKWEAEEDRTQFNFYEGRYYYPTLLTDTHAFFTEDMSPDHSHESVKAQMADGMAHFVSNYAKNKVGDDPDRLQLMMGYYGARQLPVYDALAREFAICDHWFCAHPGPTWPNRFVTLTGDLNRDSYGEPEVNTPLPADFTPSEAPTLFDLLTGRGVSWLYFQQRASLMRAFTKYSFDMTNVLEFDSFEATIKSRGLPSVTFIDPLFGDLPAGIGSPQDNDDAPPSDLKDGQQFIAHVLQKLFTPETNANWLHTMLVIVYDEHGGFYDHVQPPADATPLTGQNCGKLGPRVPAFVVSPWTPGGLVLKDTFDHGTIGATILRRFCSPNPPSMSPRVASARDLRGALPLTTPRQNPRNFLDIADTVVTPIGSTQPIARTQERRFRAPRAPDAYGAFLGGIMMTLGSTPRKT